MAWLAGLAPFFFLSYRFANRVTGLRHHVPSIGFAWEHRILRTELLPLKSTTLHAFVLRGIDQEMIPLLHNREHRLAAGGSPTAEYRANLRLGDQASA